MSLPPDSDIDMEAAHHPAKPSRPNEWTEEEVERAQSWVTYLAETVIVDARLPKTKGTKPVWYIHIDGPHTVSINKHLAWHRTIMSLKFSNTPFGTYDRSLPNRWCSVCQSYDHLANTCTYPDIPHWKKQVSLVPIEESGASASKRGGHTGTRGGFRGGRGRMHGAQV